MATEHIVEVTVGDSLEDVIRGVMAERAALPNNWQNRAKRRELLLEIDALLGQYNLHTLGR